MSAHSPATSPSAAVTADTIRRVGRGSQVALRAAASSYRERALRVISQSATALSASAWLIVDLSILVGGICWGYSLFPPPVIIVTPHIALWQAGAIFAFVVTMASLVFGLYERETLMSRSRILTRMTLTVVAATVAAYAIIYVLMYATVSRRVAALAMAVYLVGGTAIRLGAWWAIHRVHRGLLVVGSRSLYESFIRAKADGLLCEYRLVGFARAEELSPEDLNDPECFGTVRGQLNKLKRIRVTDIVVGADAADDTRMMDWMVPCLQRGCRVTNEAIFYEKATGQILVDEITPLW
ncbi:MAG: hypothetical protein KJ749_05565, partial [Planctomycetes bacterium]|nr:hypothetical protein [Planctomycetota bacterium]